MDTLWVPLLLSLKVAAIATMIAFFAGVLLAWLFTMKKNIWTEGLSLLTMLPLVLPPTVLGYYLLVGLGRRSPLGQWYEAITGSPIVFTWQAAVIAAAIAALPLVVRPVQAAFESISRQSLEAAQLDGANQWQLLIRIILPLSIPGIVAGVVLGFARAMGEFGATLMVAGNIPGQTQTLSIAIYDAVQANRMDDAHMMVIVLSIITVGFLFIISRSAGRVR
ncbi:molybdate ABC transporter permease subunit [Alteribacter natronophilus]|uniref:molybdate ABC transporter permease subunit n=1 Tax=Alteribacter natronophilus TaxID=2583810 RepID=UPI00110ED6C5|nr:molybdate ABC transporter permease subunit [Alteribacter natronophilus]TMW70349.1 molybdate ABC transporter permease subunit [Alteribacter natronophilus]